MKPEPEHFLSPVVTDGRRHVSPFSVTRSQDGSEARVD